MEKSLSKVAKSLYSDEKGFTLLELLIIIAILGILAGLIIPNVTSFIARGQISAANAELAEVGIAAQAAAGAMADGSITPQILDQAALSSANNIFTPYITGKLMGEYYIDATGAVILTGGAYAKALVLTAGDPWYNDLYFNETTAQFQNTAPGAGNMTKGVAGAAVTGGNQPSLN